MIFCMTLSDRKTKRLKFAFDFQHIFIPKNAARSLLDIHEYIQLAYDHIETLGNLQ